MPKTTAADRVRHAISYARYHGLTADPALLAAGGHAAELQSHVLIAEYGHYEHQSASGRWWGGGDELHSRLAGEDKPLCGARVHARAEFAAHGVGFSLGDPLCFRCRATINAHPEFLALVDRPFNTRTVSALRLPQAELNALIWLNSTGSFRLRDPQREATVAEAEQAGHSQALLDELAEAGLVVRTGAGGDATYRAATLNHPLFGHVPVAHNEVFLAWLREASAPAPKRRRRTATAA